VHRRWRGVDEAFAVEGFEQRLALQLRISAIVDAEIRLIVDGVSA
jgi:hypothetical protein